MPQASSPVPTAVAPPAPLRQPRPAKPRPDSLPRFHVVLLDDNDHTFDYVIEMLARLFGLSHDVGNRMAHEVDRTGRVIVLTTHKEHAELKRDQIHRYGADRRVSRCAGSMSALVEPAP
jgi:ATP-dependent Clp protease adaptor protein ClpS